MKALDRELLAENIRKSVTCGISAHELCGACVTVRQAGEDVYTECFGTTAPDGSAPVTERSLFRLASMTKPVTAVAVMILAEWGLLTLDTRIKELLPKYSEMTVGRVENGNIKADRKAVTDITVKHLLTHTSGIGCGELGVRLNSLMTEDDKKSVEATVKFFADKPLSFEPFTKEEYSAFAAFDVLAAIVERLTGEDYNVFLRKNIFLPCGMDDTTFVPSEEQWQRLVTLHNYTEEKGAFAECFEKGSIFGGFPCTHYLGGAGLASTLCDYSLFARMLLDGGEINGRRIISEESVRMISTPIFPKARGKEAWGLGVRVITRSGVLPNGAYGWSGAYGGHFWIDPENKITAVYLKNSLYDGGAGASTARQLEKDVYSALK